MFVASHIGDTGYMYMTPTCKNNAYLHFSHLPYDFSIKNESQIIIQFVTVVIVAKNQSFLFFSPSSVTRSGRDF